MKRLFIILGNSLIKRLEEVRFNSDEEIRARLIPDTEIGTGEWWIFPD